MDELMHLVDRMGIVIKYLKAAAGKRDAALVDTTAALRDLLRCVERSVGDVPIGKDELRVALDRARIVLGRPAGA
jgi:hypothetical protein